MAYHAPFEGYYLNSDLCISTRHQISYNRLYKTLVSIWKTVLILIKLLKVTCNGITNNAY